MIKIVATSPDRTEELFDLCAKVFSGGDGYFRALRHCQGGYWAGSSYDWSASQMAVDGDKIVSHVGIWKYRMRVGKARLLTGGIGAVMTHGGYRKRGIAAKVTRATIRAMREGGYGFSILFGIRDLYHRFGYVQAWPHTTHTIKLRDLPAGKGKLKLRKVSPREVLCGTGAIMRIYNRDSAALTGSAERPIYTLWHGLVDKFETRALCDSRGRTKGYLVTRKRREDLEVLEAGGMSAGCGAGQLLAALRTLARQARCSRIRFEGLSYAHPLSRVLREGNCSVEMRHSRSGGAMAAVISLTGCLEAMAGELSDRLGRSRMKGFKGVLNVAAMGESVSLHIARGKVRVGAGRPRSANRIIAGAAVARLIIGSEPPAVLARQGHVKFRGAAGELAEALFPRQWPMLNQLDRF